jgi:hypothetical protein
VKGWYWTEEERALLRTLWGSADIDDILAAFPTRSHKALSGAAARMGLRRPHQQIVKARVKAGRVSIDKMRAMKAERERRREQQEEAALQLTRVFLPAARCAPMSLSAILANPLEAAWRGIA